MSWIAIRPLSLSVLLAAACASSDRTKAPGAPDVSDRDAGGIDGSTTDSGGTDAGSDATPGDAGDSSVDGDAGGPDGAHGDGAPFPPSDIACNKNVAFRSNSVSFVFPTPTPFATAIGQFTNDPTTHSFTLVLRGVGAPASADGAISATEPNAQHDQVFPLGEKPVPVAVQVEAGKFATTSAQDLAFLRFRDDSGDFDLELSGVTFTAFTQSGCTQEIALVDAAIAASQYRKTVTIAGQQHTIAELAGLGDAGALVQLRLVVVGEAINFDFSSL